MTDMEEQNGFGTLYVVATPIGNLDDITLRAVKILNSADLIAAEDTRHSKKLLAHLNIHAKLISCHEHNETHKSPRIIQHLKDGKNIALISDAGTPCISDPGYTLVSQAAKHGIAVVPVPGCSAAIAGLSASGLPTDSFYFAGFLPRKKQQLQLAIHELSKQTATLIIYESPRRIISLIEPLIDIMGDRSACLAREITKLHEEFIRGPLSSIQKTLEEKSSVKGECSLFIQGNLMTLTIDDSQLEQILTERIATWKTGTSALARHVSDEFNLPRKTVYEMILKLSPKS